MYSCHHTAPKKSSEAGMTLASLVQLLVVIGLIAGVALKGGEMKDNVSAVMVISRAKAYNAAVNEFKFVYNQLPGDMKTPQKIPGCTSPVCLTPGNGDNVVADKKPLITSPFYFRENGENRNFWLHLAVGKYISDVDSAGKPGKYFGEWGAEFPGAPMGVKGGFHIAYYNVTPTQFSPVWLLGHYLILRATTDTYGITSAPYAISPRMAEAIDQKMDDGKPQAGYVVSTGSQNCVANGAYVQDITSSECNMLFKLSF